MKVAEENCNMILLTVVTLFTAAVAGGVALLKPSDMTQIRFADRTSARPEQASSIDRQPIYVADQPPVRIVGAPFVLNTTPRER